MVCVWRYGVGGVGFGFPWRFALGDFGVAWWFHGLLGFGVCAGCCGCGLVWVWLILGFCEFWVFGWFPGFTVVVWC